MNNKIIVFFAVVLLIAAGIIYAVYYKSAPAANQQQNQPADNMPDNMANRINTRIVAQGFVSPIAFVSPGDGTGRMFVVDQIGAIRIVDAQGNVAANVFLDLRSKITPLSANYDERGLLGMAFHPDFKNNGRFFVYYSAPLRSGAPEGWNHTATVSEFSARGDNPGVADAAREKIILRIDHPQANHNGGHIAFGPDGYLYIPMGDGGEANDVGLGHPASGNGQDTAALLGKILRVDIDNGSPYAIPSDNPFVGKNGRPEIFAYGFRNPYHISFDAGGSNALFAADAGQNLWEEVNIVAKGGNYGWNIKEGKHCFDPLNVGEALVTCASEGAQGEPLVDPIIEYGHPASGGPGVAIVGGYVYRGASIADLAGNYVFADWSKSFTGGDGSIFAAINSDGAWTFRELAIASNKNGRLGLFVKGVGQDENNELYILTSEAAGPTGTTGKIFKLMP